jgi:hypothetical protein
MEEWTSRAIADAEPGSPTHVRALLGRVFWALDEGAAAEASLLAERLGDLELRSYAWDARGVAAFRKGEFETAHMWEMRRFDLVGGITDPDHLHDMHISGVPTCAAIGRIREARRLAAENDELVADLTPHHRLHGVACLVEVEELAGNWEQILKLEPRVEAAVEENRATPCVRNGRTLLVCAAAAELSGDSKRSRELEAAGDELQAEGFGMTFSGPRTRLALAREDLDALEELLADTEWFTRQTWFALPAAAVRFDGLAVVGDEETIERDTERLLQPKSYLEPFLLRALGIVRDDERLLGQADERFRTLRLGWHAAQTARLRELRRRS